ncbi:hypothetical protein [Halalkalibacterium ligniniphilum]|uniref:hypothetical protein n=1 Tax=Halalkalibacterium ligniniphilum TaxID=1134413 RepID=UPI00034946FD|nr:hypothetical protein [Halalkalibacterium ligniniphilum]
MVDSWNQYGALFMKIFTGFTVIFGVIGVIMGMEGPLLPKLGIALVYASLVCGMMYLYYRLMDYLINRLSQSKQE